MFGQEIFALLWDGPR